MNQQSDRELLEKAAKAAGHALEADICTDDWLCIDPDENGEPFYWNPLIDDGDALRLAVKLGLAFDTKDADLNGSGTFMSVALPRNKGFAAESHGTDPYAATRRAIVRAAAALSN